MSYANVERNRPPVTSSSTVRYIRTREVTLETSPLRSVSVTGSRQGNLQPIRSDYKFIDPYCNCASVGIVQKIPYIQAPFEETLTEVHLSSACIKCGTCLAIANQINNTLLEIHESMDTWLSDVEAVFLLRNICNFAFKHYGLREMNGKRFICDHVPGATLLTSSADGLWEKQYIFSVFTYKFKLIFSSSKKNNFTMKI
ncbi:hypothetical protein KPH14_002666 [Odynerus spinipes]|uniref:Uncharacterized protein n=1 Tax=Odynerus spinipes TaxID=1348599 RepID=A0AAD9VME5_9HYME|nr:hypothetical protein KPH14_002666 [Odynerus spinipes]